MPEEAGGEGGAVDGSEVPSIVESFEMVWMGRGVPV